MCRCTGYRPILDSFRTFCKDCTCQSSCANKSEIDDKVILLFLLSHGLFSVIFTHDLKLENELFNYEDFSKIDATQEPIFPPELKVC